MPGTSCALALTLSASDLESDQYHTPQIAVFGAGAVGCYFGGMLARSGVPVTLIGRPRHVEAIQRDGLFVHGLRFQEHIHVAASTDIRAIRGREIVLFCVKTLDTEEGA